MSLLEHFHPNESDLDDNDILNQFNNTEESFDDNFTDFCIASNGPDEYHGDDHDYFGQDSILATNAAEIALTIQEAQASTANILLGHVILNQCGSLLSRTNHNIQGRSKPKFFYKKYIRLLMVRVFFCFIPKL